MFYVYILRSKNRPEQTYVGFTHDLKNRLATHNSGGSPHTAKFLPWQIEFYSAFKVEERATDSVGIKVFKTAWPVMLCHVMSETEFKLLKAPIIEAVLDVDCDMPPGQEIANLEKPARGAFLDLYPKHRTVFLQEHQIETKPEQAPKMSFRQAIQAHQFLQQDEKQLIQVRTNGFSFNRLAPYSSLDDYLPEIERAWQLFVSIASPIQIRAVRLRYINRIMIPLEAGAVKLAEYLRVYPRLPDEESLTLVGFLNQTAAMENHTGHHVNIILTSQPPVEEKLPLILDITVESGQQGEVKNWAWLYGQIMSLRSLKNRIFRNTFTERCLNLFQQP